MPKTLTDITDDLTAALGAAAQRFTGEMERLAVAALAALNADRPRLREGEIKLEPGKWTYPGPEDLVAVSIHQWGMNDGARQWDSGYAGTPPRVTVQRDGATPWIIFSPAPTVRQVMAWGAKFKFRYRARHIVTAEDSTLADDDVPLLILRAMAQAMEELAAAGVVQSIQTHRGMGASLPANATPAALARYFIEEYRRRVRGG